MAKISTHAQPVRIRVAALSTSNLTLSGAQTIDSVACVAGDLVGALGQSNSKNGVYMVQSGAWLAVDPGFGTGLEVYATAGEAMRTACTVARPPERSIGARLRPRLLSRKLRGHPSIRHRLETLAKPFRAS